jgi:hypothetical protein
MSSAHDHSPASTPHPSPHRGRVHGVPMWFAILGAPVAWSLQQLIAPTMFMHGCYPNDTPLFEPIWGNARPVALWIEAVAILVCLAAGAVAWRNWARSRDEKEGSAHHLIEAGDGRTRFMALVGLICSGLFLIVIVFSTGLLYMVPPCNG